MANFTTTQIPGVIQTATYFKAPATIFVNPGSISQPVGTVEYLIPTTRPFVKAPAIPAPTGAASWLSQSIAQPYNPIKLDINPYLISPVNVGTYFNYLKTETLMDTFGGSSLNSSKWNVDLSGGGTITESGGHLIITPIANDPAYEACVPVQTNYNLQGSFALVQITQRPNGTCPAILTIAQEDYGEAFYIKVTSTQIISGSWNSGDTTYLNIATTPVWVRIREGLGYIYFDYSFDGIFWTTFDAFTDDLSNVNDVVTYISVENYGAEASPGAVWFANFNTNLTPNPVSYAGLGMLMFATQDGSSTVNNTKFDAHCDAIVAKGITTIKIGLTSFTDSGAISQAEAACLRAKAKGLKVWWGLSPGNTTLTSSNWASYVSAVETAATWAQTNGLDAFFIGNEVLDLIDGTTITTTTAISDLKSLATTIQTYFTSGPVFYNEDVQWLSNWVSAGKGDIDQIGWDIYPQGGGNITSNWQSEVDTIFSTWGPDTFIGEFSPDYNQLSGYSSNENVQAQQVANMLSYIAAKGIPYAFWFCFYDNPSNFGPPGFGALKTDGTYRALWNVFSFPYIPVDLASWAKSTISQPQSLAIQIQQVQFPFIATAAITVRRVKLQGFSHGWSYPI